MVEFNRENVEEIISNQVKIHSVGVDYIDIDGEIGYSKMSELSEAFGRVTGINSNIPDSQKVGARVWFNGGDGSEDLAEDLIDLLNSDDIGETKIIEILEQNNYSVGTEYTLEQ